MQQTDKYQLNLIENEDTFSPDPLNGNAEKLEAALIRLEGADAAEAQARAAADIALDQRIRVFEARKVVFGYHEGEGFVSLGFTPMMVFANGTSVNCFVIQGCNYPILSISEGGFSHNSSLANCHYLAIL